MVTDFDYVLQGVTIGLLLALVLIHLQRRGK